MSDEYQSIPVAVARAAVQASGELEGIEGPNYLAHDEAEWRPYFTASQSSVGHPILAAVTITRKGQKPREVIIAWDEYAEQMDADPEWDALRASKPMSIFGAEVERHAYRVVFADVLAAAMPPRIVVGNVDPSAIPTNNGIVVLTDDRPAAGWDLPARDWFTEVKAADAATLNALTDEARAAGALAKVNGLQQAFMDRLLELELEQAKRPKSTPKTAPPRPPQGKRRRGGHPRGHVAA